MLVMNMNMTVEALDPCTYTFILNIRFFYFYLTCWTEYVGIIGEGKRARGKKKKMKETERYE